jgi:HK97 family phage major capsid protein
MAEKRALSGTGVLIPDVFLGVLRENVVNYSKLYSRVNVRPLTGTGRMAVAGTVPEAVWTEMCANLNELDLAFNSVEVDGYKVGGYMAICNATIEDSEIDLAAEIMVALAQSIGIALDKAILYGRNAAGTQKMPMGIVTRLAQTSKPSDYPVTARPWVDLHSTNIVALTAGLTGAALIAAIVEASGKAKSSYSRGEKVWVMNETTYTKLMAATVSVDAAGRVVSGVSDRMPVVGGIIEVLNFLPDNVIIGGYFDLYLLAERAGNQFAESEHVFFIQDQTCFKGTARYDGQPVIAEGFVAIGLEGTTPNATMPFAPDNANTVTAILTNSSAVTLDPTDTFQIIAKTLPVDGPVTFASSAPTYATVSADGLITAVAQGSATITITSGSATATVAVTVTAGA